MKIHIQKLFVYISILMLLLLTACSGSSDTSSESKETKDTKTSSTDKTMYIGLTNNPATLNPINATDVSSQILSSILFESLFDLDEKFNFLPKLADSMETEDNQTFTIKLNPAAKWTDGEPFKAEDIVFTLNLMADPKVTSTGLLGLSIIDGLDDKGKLAEGITDISGLTIVDSHTLQVKTKIPVDLNYMKKKLGEEIRFLPEHVLKDKNRESLHQDPFMQNPDVTTGAFKFDKFAKDQFVGLTANEAYYRGKPKLSKLFFKIMPSANLVAQLQTGEIHMNLPTVGPIDVDDFEKVKNMSNLEFVPGNPLYVALMIFNMNTITNKEIRQAMAYAVNRELIVDKLFKGVAKVSEGPYPPVHPYYTDDVKKYSFDPEKAKEMLKKAGWDFNKTINFAVPTGMKVREQSATVIAENLQAIGVKVQMNKYDLPTIIQKARNKEYDVMLIGTPFQLDPDVSIYYHSQAPFNFSGYNNPEMDLLLDKGRKEVDPEKRKEIYTEITNLIQEDLPMFTYHTTSAPGAVSKKVKVGAPKDIGMFYNVHEWDLEE